MRTEHSRRTSGANAAGPVVSVVLATHNRREVAQETLRRLRECELARADYEIIAVDNASTDDTPRAIAGLVDELIELPHNGGSCAKARGVRRARGRYVVFVDDDSCPRRGSLARMIARFEADRWLGAAGFTVHLPGGEREGGALPGVFVGCGVGFRAEALREVGGLDESFFMQAEEYDVCFRLGNAGWKVEVFDDLHVEHRKAATSRQPARTTYFDIRNNLRVLARYAPAEHYATLRTDCVDRYGWLAQRLGHIQSYRRGLRAGTWRGRMERLTYRRRRMNSEVFERYFRWNQIERRMRELATGGLGRVVLVDLGKNIYGFHRAAQRCGIVIEAVGDDRFAATGRAYRGVPVVSLAEALSREFDAAIVSNCSTVHAATTADRARKVTKKPVFSWFREDPGAGGRVSNFGSPPNSADKSGEGASVVAGA